VGSLLLGLALAAHAAEPLRIGLEGTYPPFSFYDDKGSLTGFEVELAKSLAEHMGRRPEFVTARWDGLLASLDSGRFDVVMNMVTITEERKKLYGFSAPYCYSGLQLVVGKGSKVGGLADLPGKRVGVGLNSIHETWLRRHVPDADIRTYDDDSTRNQDLLLGRLDAILNDRLAIAYLIQRYQGRLMTAGEPFDIQEKAVALRKDRSELREEIDRALAAMRKDGSLTRISTAWFNLDVSK